VLAAALTTVFFLSPAATVGQGGLGSTLVGVLLLGITFNVFNLEGTISSWWQWVLRGVFLLAVVVMQNSLSRRSRK